MPEGYKELSEIKGKVISDYQVYLEKEWIKRFKKKPTTLKSTSVPIAN